MYNDEWWWWNAPTRKWIRSDAASGNAAGGNKASAPTDGTEGQEPPVDAAEKTLTKEEQKQEKMVKEEIASLQAAVIATARAYGPRDPGVIEMMKKLDTLHDRKRSFVGKAKRVEALKRETESITAKLERLRTQKEELGKKLQTATDEAYVTEERLTLFTRKLTEAENGDTTDEEDADVGIGSASQSSLSLQSPSQGNSDEVKELKSTVQGLAANLAQLTALLTGQAAFGPPAPATPGQTPSTQPTVMATYAAALGTAVPVASAVVAAAPMSPAGATQGSGAEVVATPDVSAGVAAKTRTAGAARTGANAHKPHPNACLKDAKHPKKGAESVKDDGEVSSDDGIMTQEEFAKKLAEVGEAAANRVLLSPEEQVNL